MMSDEWVSRAVLGPSGDISSPVLLVPKLRFRNEFSCSLISHEAAKSLRYNVCTV
jgi:hypothetical protein